MNLGKKKLKVVSNLCEMENRQNVTRNQSKWEKMMVRPNHYWLLACLQQNTTRKQGRDLGKNLTHTTDQKRYASQCRGIIKTLITFKIYSKTLLA